MDNIITMFAGIDKTYILICAAILVIAGIVALVMKALKIGIVVVLVACLIYVGGNYIEGLQAQYNVYSNGNTIYFTLEGVEQSIDFKDVSKVLIKDSSKLNYKEYDIVVGEDHIWVSIPKIVSDKVVNEIKNLDLGVEIDIK